MTVQTKQTKLFVAALTLAVAATAGCRGSRLPSATSTAPPDLVKITGEYKGDDGDSESFEVIADGNRRFRETILIGPDAGSYVVWDGKVLLMYSPNDDPKYQRTENPGPDEFTPVPFFYQPGTEEFKQLCPAAKRLGTKTMFGRTVVRYHCDKVEASDQAEGMDAKEIALDEKTGLELAYGDPAEVITAVAFGPAITADTFSTKLPPGATTAPTEGELTPAPPPSIGSFRLNAVGGGFLDSKSYAGKPLVIVAGSADGIRTALGRLLPMTRGGKPPVLGFLVVLPPDDWKGSLTNSKDVDQLAASISKSAGKFAVPVGIDFKGAASYAFTADVGMPPDLPTPPDATMVTIALVSSKGTFAHITLASDVTDGTLRTWIAALS